MSLDDYELLTVELTRAEWRDVREQTRTFWGDPGWERLGELLGQMDLEEAS